MIPKTFSVNGFSRVSKSFPHLLSGFISSKLRDIRGEERVDKTPANRPVFA
jgi:hypothetical protein